MRQAMQWHAHSLPQHIQEVDHTALHARRDNTCATVRALQTARHVQTRGAVLLTMAAKAPMAAPRIGMGQSAWEGLRPRQAL